MVMGFSKQKVDISVGGLVNMIDNVKLNTNSGKSEYQLLIVCS